MISGASSSRPVWQTILLFVLAFWLSGSLILDTVMMPVMYSAGMMATPDFATAGYSMFWVFNRIELLCAALVMTAALVLHYARSNTQKFGLKEIVFAALLLDIALIYTYGLTPQMSVLGLQLNLFSPVGETPVLMDLLHGSYWLLEMLKLTVAALLLRLCYRSTTAA